MEIYKTTPYLIERLRTADIDNLKEVSVKFPTTFDEIFEDLKANRYWHDVKFDTVLSMCSHLTIGNEKIQLTEFHKFFKDKA